MPAGFMPARHTAIASRGKPEGGDTWNSPLPAVTVSAENHINGMMSFDIVKNVWGMGQQHRKARFCRRRDASEIRTMERWIIDADDCQLSFFRRNDGTLID